MKIHSQQSINLYKKKMENLIDKFPIMDFELKVTNKTIIKLHTK
jgi:hypothetical protein